MNVFELLAFNSFTSYFIILYINSLITHALCVRRGSLLFFIYLFWVQRLYSTPAKAWGMLTWLDSDSTRGTTMSKGNGTLARRKDLWSMPTVWPSWGRVRFAPDMDTQHSEKGDSDPLWSNVMKSFPFIGYACARQLLGTRASLSMPLMSLSLSKDCSPRSGKVTFHAAILTLACLLSLLQPLHSATVVLGFK